MKVKSIMGEKRQVSFFDITVARNHNFVVNGCLVHNCNTSAQNAVIVGNHGVLIQLMNWILFKRLDVPVGLVNRRDHVWFICDSVDDWETGIQNPKMWSPHCWMNYLSICVRKFEIDDYQYQNVA